jgi:hypothetical protein
MLIRVECANHSTFMKKLCPTCKIELEITFAGSDVWSYDHYSCPTCNGTYNMEDKDSYLIVPDDFLFSRHEVGDENKDRNMQETKSVKIGDPVTFVNSLRQEIPALVTAVWSATCINIVVVSDDKDKTDTYGRQIERYTSVMHKSLQGDVTFGNCWY